MNQDLSIVSLVLQASLVVQIVMAGLLVVSLASWTVIFGKGFGLKRVRRGNDDFERDFWSGRNLTELQQQVGTGNDAAPMARIFASGMREFLKLREKRLDAAAQLDGARRAMRASFQREIDAVETHLSFLASVGSVSPYVGLFGTVWGIMHAFVGLSNLTQVTLATVAPGIAEALVATALGLFAAIPAVVAYNRFARDIDRIAIQLETFIEEFLNILQRHAGTPSVAAAGAIAPGAGSAAAGTASAPPTAAGVAARR
ncbi:MAG: protein TolQ [Burkholderiales bacterium]|nr:protein TolQ [Burkholderiales bacterium]